MGKIVTFASLPSQTLAPGVSLSPITQGDTKAMTAELLRLAPGSSYEARVPVGSDQYLFTLTGAAQLTAAGAERAMPHETFANVEEGSAFTLANKGTAPAEIIKVTAPPPGTSEKLGGFVGGANTVSQRDVEPVLVPEQKKQRIYFAGKESTKTERGHAMIVVYEKETFTAMHMHPNAESMFIFLTGQIKFTVNGEETVVGRGQATYFPTADRHALKCAEGTEAASFLEFHVPGAFTTVRG